MGSPVVLIKGEDPVLVADAVRAAIDTALDGEDRGLALEELASEDLTPSSVVDAAQTPPFLTARRVLVVREVGRWSSDEVAPLVAYLAAPSDTAALILVAGGGQTSQKLANAVKKAGSIIDTAPGTGRARAGWLAERLASAPVRMDAAAGRLIESHLGEDVGRLGALLDTLAAVYGPGARVGAAELEPYLGDAGGLAPWDLTDAIDKGDTAAALAVLKRMGDRHPLVILATLQRHMAAMLRLHGAGVSSDQEAAALVGMAPYPAKKALAQASRLGGPLIGEGIALIAAADLDLRGNRELDEDLVMEILVARLSRLPHRR